MVSVMMGRVMMGWVMGMVHTAGSAAAETTAGSAAAKAATAAETAASSKSAATAAAASAASGSWHKHYLPISIFVIISQFFPKFNHHGTFATCPDPPV